MSLPDARARLAEAQASLVRSLVAHGEPPPGFAAERIRQAGRALVNKRVREVARSWPALVEALGAQFDPRFREFARATPPPAEGGPLADGRAFLRTLAAAELTDDLRRDALWADLATGHRFRLAWLRVTGRLLVGVRFPWLGPRILALPLRRIVTPARTPAAAPPRAGG